MHIYPHAGLFLWGSASELCSRIACSKLHILERVSQTLFLIDTRRFFFLNSGIVEIFFESCGLGVFEWDFSKQPSALFNESIPYSKNGLVVVGSGRWSDFSKFSFYKMHWSIHRPVSDRIPRPLEVLR